MIAPQPIQVVTALSPVRSAAAIQPRYVRPLSALNRKFHRLVVPRSPGAGSLLGTLAVWAIGLRASRVCAAMGAGLVAAEPLALAAAEPATALAPTQPSPGGDLAYEVGTIADSPNLARARKEKRISELVREAIVRMGRASRSSDVLLKAVRERVTAAAVAAPQFTDTIARAAAYAPPMASLDGAAARIRAVAFAGARRAAGGRSERVTAFAGSGGAANGVRDSDVALANAGSGEGRARFGKNHSIAFTGGISVSHDSNIFLQSQDERSETITAVSPGVELSFGQRSRAGGRLSYEVAFTDYANNSGPRARLGKGGAEFRYDNGRTTLDAVATYQQLEQGTRDTASVAGNALLRRTVTVLNVSGETALTAKSSVESGVSLDWTRYRRPGLVGGSNLTIPVKVYLAATPKLAVSTGFSFEKFTPQGTGEGSKGAFYNVGLRGNLTEKLGSNFSFGYRTRDFARGISEGFWGFDGSFDYQATAKTSMRLGLSRDFLSSASGESLRSSSYALGFATAPTLHWQFAGGISYRSIDYGPRVFVATPGVLVDGVREDSYQDYNLSATYIVNSWMRLTTAWTQRLNRSNDTTFDFTSNLFSLVVGFQF